jgi:nicotinate-nucleotide adenylyltransferase
MSGRRRIGVLGGTFNPIHVGHLIMAENALDQLGLDEVLFTPAGDPPHKPAAGIIDARQRAHLVRLAIAGRPGFECSTIDLEHQGPSYTWQLLERLLVSMPGANLHFIVGGDSLRDFGSWARPDRILELARIAAVERPGFPLDDAILEAVPRLRAQLDLVEAPLMSISATEIRERVRRGRSIRYLVPEPVRIAIGEHGLFRTPC